MGAEELKILIVEDNPVMRQLAWDVLVSECDKPISSEYQLRLPIEKMGAGSGKEAIELCKHHHFDIILLDIGLPDISGKEVLQSIKILIPRSMIIMLTKSALKSDVEECMQLGAECYVVKPFSKKRIIETILWCLEQKENKKQTTKPMMKLLRPVTMEIDKEESGNIESTEELKSVLFVDKFIANQTHVRNYLKRVGYLVEAVTNGKDALKNITKKPYDAIILDTKLDGLSGYEIARRIRSLKYMEELIIIGLVDSKGELDQRLWLESGMNNFLMKPTKLDQLGRMLDRYIGD